VARDLVPGRHWLIVLGCVTLACLPPRLRDGLRGKLLDLTARTTSRGDAPEERETVRERELANKLALSEAARSELERALDELKAASEITANRTDLRLIPCEAFPLAGPGELVRRLVLGRGQREGVETGQPVLAGSALAGFIALATKEKCEVRLVTDPTFRLRCTAPRAGIDGILAGNGGATLTFTPAPSGDEDSGRALKAGDVLVVSRASTLCTVAAVVGTIREVERAPGEATSRAIVVPAAHVARLTRAVVVRVDASLAATRSGGEASSDEGAR
jgi:rod shape-determining protein MreC